MTRLRGATILVVALLAPLVAHAQVQTVRATTLAEYRGALQTLRDTVRDDANPASLAAAAQSLPASWSVQTGGEPVVVSNAPLRRQLESLAGNDNAAARSVLQSALQQRLADLDAYEATAPESSASRKRLDEILSRREFSAVHGPTWWDRLKRRATQFVLDLLAGVFGSSSAPVVASIFVYLVMLFAVIVTALWLYRTLGGRPEPVVTGAVPVSAKQSTVWLREAREAAAAGRWRDAVHLAYWAGISSLESQGVWPPDRARTPREYIRLLPPSSAHGPALAAITRLFEPVWYGYRDANAETFAKATDALRKLGCEST